MYQIFIITCLILQVRQQHDQLINVQAIWRHGARDYYYCNWGCDPKNQYDGDSQLLTPAGMRQQYVLGKWLRQRYIIDNHLLSQSFNENEIYIESTDYNRTLMSAYCNLQGMYPQGQNVPNVTNDKLLPPNKGAITPIDIGNNALPNQIQFIPVHSKQEELDYALSIYCHTSNNQDNKQTDLYKQINSATKTQLLFDDFNSQLNLIGDKAVNDIIELAKWRDTFTCNRYNGGDLPPKLTAKTLHYMDKIALLSFSLRQFQTWEQSKKYSTPYLRQLINYFDNFINGTSKVKYIGSSSHDSTMLAILSGLNLTSAQCQAQIYLNGTTDASFCLTSNVEFSSNLIFELYNSSEIGLYIKVLYNGEYMPICSNGKTCMYQTFKSIITSQLIDYEKECNLTNSIPQPPVSQLFLYFQFVFQWGQQFQFTILDRRRLMSQIFNDIIINMQQKKQNKICEKYQLIGDYLIGLDLPLGSGSQGQVYEGKNIFTNESVAVKKFPKENIKIGDYETVKQLFNMELRILKACKEKQIPNIVGYIDHLETDGYYYLILELCEQSLRQYLEGHGQIPEIQTIQWISQIVGAMKTLHELGYCHRDLKPENIVIQDDQVKIIDLSFGRCMPSNNENILIQSKMGTPGYKAPEIELGPYSPYLSDIYSLGVVFYEMLFGKKNILKDEGKIIFPKSPQINQKIMTLIESMTNRNPKQRADWYEVSSALQYIQELLLTNGQNQLQVSANLFQSSVYYSEKWQKDIEFLLSIIEDSSVLAIQAIYCTPCLLLINKIAIDKVEKKIISLNSQQDQKLQKTIENLNDWLKTLQYQLRGQISSINKFYTDFSTINLPIREMKDELKNELSSDYKSTFQKQVKYYFNYFKEQKYININTQCQIQKLQLKLLMAYDYETEFENVRSQLLAVQYEIQENLIDYLNRLFKQEKTEVQSKKLIEMVNNIKVILPQ